MDIAFLLAELGEGESGQQAVQPHLAEVFLSAPAAERLAAMLNVELPRLQWALPHLRETRLLPGQQARWEWPWYPMEHYLVPACSRCVALRGGGWGPIWLVWPESWKICDRHGQFTHVRQSGSGVELAPLAQVVRAHRQCRRFERRHGPVGAYLTADAFAITGWWWRTTVVECWAWRAQRAGRPESDLESAWLWMYPEAVAVARALLDYERQAREAPQRAVDSGRGAAAGAPGAAGRCARTAGDVADPGGTVAAPASPVHAAHSADGRTGAAGDGAHPRRRRTAAVPGRVVLSSLGLDRSVRTRVRSVRQRPPPPTDHNYAGFGLPFTMPFIRVIGCCGGDGCTVLSGSWNGAV
ncbi:hypothetical protein ACMATS_00340 [Streptoverticillium reticulum]|uniref:hypothetical protein n=1 Tax=Streptoverticillium reticulum TaxID=1433415 RepID=UPI0039BFB311